MSEQEVMTLERGMVIFIDMILRALAVLKQEYESLLRPVF